MAATILQKSFQNSKIFNKTLFIEMNNTTAAKDLFCKPDSMQRKDIYNLNETSGQPPFQGSVTSLESRSFADQSEVQPLTEVHTCRYDECHKFHQSKLTKETIESPASPLKTAFLYLVIILLILWIIIYSVLTQLGFIY